MVTNEPEYSDEAEATLPLFDKATLTRFAFGVGVVTGVGVGVTGVGVGVAGVGVGVAGVGVVTGVGVVVTVLPLQASSSTIRLYDDCAL